MVKEQIKVFMYIKFYNHCQLILNSCLMINFILSNHQLKLVSLRQLNIFSGHLNHSKDKTTAWCEAGSSGRYEAE